MSLSRFSAALVRNHHQLQIGGASRKFSTTTITAPTSPRPFSLSLSSGSSKFLSQTPQTNNFRRHASIMAASFKNASCTDAFKTLGEEGVFYLDVRTPEEFNDGHVPNAVLVPLMFSGPGGMTPNNDFLSQVQQEIPNMDATVLVGCKSGARSNMAAEKLAAVGYSDLINVEGGYMAWVNSGLPTTK